MNEITTLYGLRLAHLFLRTQSNHVTLSAFHPSIDNLIRNIYAILLDIFSISGECVDNTWIYIQGEDPQMARSSIIHKIGSIFICGKPVPLGFVSNQCDGNFSFVKNPFSSITSNFEALTYKLHSQY